MLFRSLVGETEALEDLDGPALDAIGLRAHVSFADPCETLAATNLARKHLRGALVDDSSTDLKLGKPGGEHELRQRVSGVSLDEGTMATHSCGTGANDKDIDLGRG